MRRHVFGPLAGTLLFSTLLFSAEFRGSVLDPSGAAVSGAQVALAGRVGVVAQSTTGADGAFRLKAENVTRLVVAAPGFATRTLPLGDESPAGALSVQLELAPRVESVSVVGSAIDVSTAEQGSSVSVIPRDEIRQRNEALAVDLLRSVPGVAFSQTGPTGGVAGLYIRGGYPSFNLVQIDGVPVNTFGGNFDFAHVPSLALERVEVVRGPQSAVYGSYANSGVINFVTRSPEAAPSLDVLAEGGSHDERRFGLGATARLAGFGIALSASRLDTNGPVPNADYRNENLLLNVSRRFRRQSLSVHAGFDSNENGVPGPWGSDPRGTYTDIDTVSRNKNNFSDYMAHYEADLSSRVRQEVFATFFLNNNGFVSPYGFSLNKDVRGQAESRTVVSVTSHYTVAFGASVGQEQVNNSFITDASFSTFPLRRRDAAVYVENRLDVGGRLFLNAGLRGEFLRTLQIPADGYSRPYFPESTISRASPKVAAAFVLRPDHGGAFGSARLHSSFGTGIRPPGGFDLAYTDNPALKPERTRSFDAGIEQTLFHNRLSLDGTYFHNRFSDLIVILGGALSALSRYHSDNLAASNAYGAEFSARLRPARWVFITGSYTWLQTEILSVHGSLDVAPAPFAVGQELLRRPKHSGNLVATFTRGRVTANATGVFRGSTLDVEPAYGAANGLFRNRGYADFGLNLNYALGHGLTAYGNLRNALNWHYEEVLGYPSPLLNFVAGLKWNISKPQ